MDSIRQTCGLAGYPKRDESSHDAFGVGHSSTSISAGLGNIHFCFLKRISKLLLISYMSYTR